MNARGIAKYCSESHLSLRSLDAMLFHSHRNTGLYPDAMRIAFVGTYTATAAAAVIIYEHVITLDRAVDFILNRKKTGVTVLFVLNRSIAFLVAIGLLLSTIDWTTNSRCCQSSCDITNIWLQVFQGLLLLVLAAFSAVRVYAVGVRAWKCAAVVFALNLVPIASNTLYDANTYYQHLYLSDYGNACLEVVDLSASTKNILIILTRVSVIVADIIVLAVTWISTYHIKRDADRVHMKTPLVTFLLRDGTIHFILLLLLNITQMLSYLLDVFAFMSFFSLPFSSIIISHFLLDLRQIDLINSPDNTSDLFLYSIVGNMGAPPTSSLGVSSRNDRACDADHEGAEDRRADCAQSVEAGIIELWKLSVSPLRFSWLVDDIEQTKKSSVS